LVVFTGFSGMLVVFSGFAFVTFESEDAVDNVIAQHFHEINNKLVSIYSSLLSFPTLTV